jgi:hypothetical protein
MLLYHRRGNNLEADKQNSMARLPTPGADDGVWGDILNEYLGVSHKQDGTVKDNTIGTDALQDDSVSVSQLQDNVVGPTKLATGNTPSPGQVLSYDGSGFEWTNNAGTPGQDGAGVPTGGTTGQILAKASNTDHDTEWIAPTGGDVSSVFGRTGAVTAQNNDYSASQVSNTPAGNIAATSVQAAINELDSEKASAADLAGKLDFPFSETFTGVAGVLGEFTVVNDGSPTASWPDRFRTFFTDGANTRLVQWWNEYGEWRAHPARQSTVAWRLFGAPTSAEAASRNPNNHIWEIADNRQDRNAVAKINHLGDMSLAGNLTVEGSLNGIAFRGMLAHDEAPQDGPGVYLRLPEP